MDCETFLEGVRKYDNANEFQPDYVDLVLKPREVWENLETVSRENVENVVMEFLKRWKIRNHNRIDPEELMKTLRDLNESSRFLPQGGLLDYDFAEEDRKAEDGVSNSIEKMYDQLMAVHGVGSTSTSKILHGINPPFFVMWEEKARLGYGFAKNSIGYLRFLFESQRILSSVVSNYREKRNCNYEAAIEEIAKEANTKEPMSLTKLLDQYNFVKFNREKDLPNPYFEFFSSRNE